MTCGGSVSAAASTSRPDDIPLAELQARVINADRAATDDDLTRPADRRLPPPQPPVPVFAPVHRPRQSRRPAPAATS